MGNKKRDWSVGNPIIKKYYEDYGMAFTHRRVEDVMGYVPKSAMVVRAREMGLKVNPEVSCRLSVEGKKARNNARKVRCMVEVNKNYRKHGPEYCAESIGESKKYVTGVAGEMNIQYEARTTKQRTGFGYRYPVDMDYTQQLAGFLPWRSYPRERCSDSVGVLSWPR